MAFRKLIAVAACLSVSYAAPQQLVQASPYGGTVLRSGFLPATTQFVSHAAHPTVLRTIAQPSVVRTVAHAAPLVQRVVEQPIHEVTHIDHQEEVEYVDDNAQYNFGYSVSDARSGDFKDRQESRDGNVVTGSYSVADPDGRIRHVEYTADAVNGFQARVTYDGEAGPPAIPFNAPAPAATTTAFVADSAVASDDVAIIGARNQVITQAASPQVVRTVAAAPQVVRTVAAAPQVVRTVAAAPQFVRTVAAAPTAVHAIHNSPQFVRTFNAAPTAVHAIHNSPQFVRTFNAAPAAVHAVNNSPQFVRTFAAAPNVHAVHNSANVVRAFNTFENFHPTQTLVHV